MHPIERLRYVARSSGDAAELVDEVADALQDLSGDPRALLTASRRLLDAHPDCGPLWWLTARVLCSVEPALAAEEARELIAADVTAEELAASLPAAATVAAVPSRLVLGALSLRPDLTVRLVGSPSSLRPALRRLGVDVAEVTGHAPAEALAALEGASVVVAEALAASAVGVLLTREAAALVRRAADRQVPPWLVAGQGAVLPPALFEACCSRATGAGGPAGVRRAEGDAGLRSGHLGSPPAPGRAVERVPPDVFAVAVTDAGRERPGVALAAAGCPAPSELTRLAG